MQFRRPSESIKSMLCLVIHNNHRSQISIQSTNGTVAATCTSVQTFWISASYLSCSVDYAWIKASSRSHFKCTTRSSLPSGELIEKHKFITILKIFHILQQMKMYNKRCGCPCFTNQVFNKFCIWKKVPIRKVMKMC